VDGLTLAGARKQLLQEIGAPNGTDASITDADVAALMDQQLKVVLRQLRGGLESILGVLGGGAHGAEFALRAQAVAAPVSAKKAAPAKARTAPKKAGKAKK